MQRVQRSLCALCLVPPMITTYLTIVQYLNKEIDIGTTDLIPSILQCTLVCRYECISMQCYHMYRFM